MRPAPVRSTLLLLGPLAISSGAAAQTSQPAYSEACGAGDMQACNVFGLMYQHGEGVTQDPARALNLYILSCDGGVADACGNIGLLFRRGLAASDDFDLVRAHYAEACDVGDTSACNLVETLDDIDVPEPGELFTRRGLVANADTRAVLDNALVTVVGEDRHVVSDATGRVVLDQMPAGEYTLRVERAGYESADVRVGVPESDDFLVLLDALPSDRSTGQGSVIGRVTDEAGMTLSDVDVSVVGRPGARAITGPNGRFRLAGQSPGLLEVRFDRLGYTPRTATLVVQPASTTDLVVEMPTDAIELEPIEVAIRAPFLERAGFYERRDRGGGYFLDRQELDRRPPPQVADAIEAAPGVRVQNPNGYFPEGARIAVVRGPPFQVKGGCILQLYIDGQLRPANLNQVNPADVEAIEVFHGAQIPIEYKNHDACGVVLIWLRH